jgi:CRISPR-associated protein Cmr4
MKQTATLLLWQAITPLHSGTGQSGAGVIDLPVAREVATGFPMIPASSIKGVLRDGRQDAESKAWYGSLEAAGQLTFTDARLLCLPVRSYKGTFAYVTCPLVIGRLARDLAALGLPHTLPDLPDDIAEGQAHVTGETLQHGGKVLFEDIDLEARDCARAGELAKVLGQWAGRAGDFTQRLAVVPNDVFTYFSETATEVSAHVRLKSDTKTVEDGALWYEEALPAESLLSSFLLKGGVAFTPRSPLQIGGKGSVGRGLLSVREVGEVAHV